MINKLQINLLSKSGELISVVRCFAGQISVFRGVTPRDLEPYQRGLAGVPGPERLSITVDSAPYRAEDQIIIGYGEHFGNDDRTVQQFLIDCGASENGLDPLLLAFGLERFGHRPCRNLPPSEERIVRLLAAMLSSNKVVVINNPFEPIASQLRERMAEFIVQNVRARNLIIAVTDLNYRPQCWIENEAVSRIQVGDAVQKTIGFASGKSEVADMIAAVRAQAKSGMFELEQRAALRAQSGVETQPRSTSVETPRVAALFARLGSLRSLVPQFLDRRLFAGGLALALAALTTTVLVLNRQEPTSLTDPSTPLALNLSTTPSPKPQPEIVKRERPPVIVVAAATPPPPSPTATPPQSALDFYPPEVKSAVLAAFSGKTERVAAAPRSALLPQAAAGAPARGSEDLLQFLKGAEQADGDGSAASQGPANPFGLAAQMPQPFLPPAPDGGTQQSDDERREIIRQRFLDAINKAAMNRREENF